MKRKIALFHPWIKSRGGAEKTILEILKNIKDVDLYTWVYDKENTFEEFKKFNIHIVGSRFFKRFSHSNILRGAFLLNGLFSKIPLDKYDIFLISTSGVGEFITFRNYKPNKTYAYVHTPLRDADKEIMKWSLKNKYKNILSRIIYLSSVSIYKILEKVAWKRIDYPIFNSELSLERAKNRGLIEGKKTKVIYPPTDLKNSSKIKYNKSNYFLYPSRINKPKRQELLVRAWEKFSERHPNEKLIIAGNIEDKRYYENIKELSKNIKNIEIKTNLDKTEFIKLYKGAKAIIFIPYMEDFGIVPFEALSFGKPLIAVDKGGYYKLVEDIPQVYKIRELEEEKMINEINTVLEKFLNSKIKPKVIMKPGLNTESFINNLNKVLE